MDKLHELVAALRMRVAKLKEAAIDCANVADRLALGIRADEAERCAVEIEKVLCNDVAHT